MSTAIETNLTERVNKALASIRPFLVKDGGDVELVEITNGTVKVKLLGSCKSCSMSSMTLKGGIEDTILKAVSEIKNVIAVE